MPLEISENLKRSLFAAQKLFSTVLKLASLQIQNSPSGLKQLDLQPFRLAKNRYRKNLDSLFRAPFSRDLDGYPGRQNRLHPMS